MSVAYAVAFGERDLDSGEQNIREACEQAEEVPHAEKLISILRFRLRRDAEHFAQAVRTIKPPPKKQKAD